VNLRKKAKGRECEVRVPGYCLPTNETVIGAHVRMINISGYGLKAPDIFIANCCQACHDVCDRRVPSEYTYEQCRLMLLEGMVRTQNILWREGLIRA
jgi:hypothetical protein